MVLDQPLMMFSRMSRREATVIAISDPHEAVNTDHDVMGFILHGHVQLSSVRSMVSVLSKRLREHASVTSCSQTLGEIVSVCKRLRMASRRRVIMARSKALTWHAPQC